MSVSVSDQALEGRGQRSGGQGGFHQHYGAASLYSLSCWDSPGARSGVSVNMIYYSELVQVAQSVNFMDTYSEMLLIIHYFTVWKRRRRYTFNPKDHSKSVHRFYMNYAK